MMETFALSPYRQPLSPSQTSKMISSALKQPGQHVRELTGNAVTMFGLDDSQNTTRLRDCFGLVVQKELMEIPCRFLAAPGIMYGGRNPRTISVRDASWNLRGLAVGEACSTRTVQVLDMSELQPNAGDTALDENFEEALERALRSININAQVPDREYLRITNATVDITQEALQNELARIVPADRRNNTSLVIVIPRHSFDLYSVIKRAADLNLGIQTACVAADKLAKLVFDSEDSKTTMHLANIGLKLNLKGNGYNHKIVRDNIRELYKPVSSGSLDKAECDTIVIGADVTHPLGHCASACPSVAAVVGSVDDDFTKFPASMRLQRSKQEIITDLYDMVMERLLDWADKHDNRLPGSMLFYRDGVSESQFDTVRAQEIVMLQQAFYMADGHIRRENGEPQRKEKVPFRLTFVVVGKRHNIRFFPKPGNEKDHINLTNRNVKPGLVVDQVITHPYIMDFYLQSHLPIKGTGRSAHYFVLQNKMALSSNRLQQITHAFCYNYARATKGASYCGPAYYADRLCDRGRAYIRDWLIGREGYAPSRVPNNGEKADAYKTFVVIELHDDSYYRPDQSTPKYGRIRKNPWHPNLDDIMFYL